MIPGSAQFAREGGTWFIRLCGDLRHTLGPSLNALLDQAFAAEDTAGFLLDLSAAEAIDSTCLGVLARIADWSRRQNAPRPVLVTDNEDIIETLYAVCFDRLFELRGEPGARSGDWSDLPAAGSDAAQMADLVLEAHRRLCAIDDKNRTAFRDVIEALERDPGTDDSGDEPP